MAGFFGQTSQLGKARKMPLLIAQGETDRVVKAERARAKQEKSDQRKAELSDEKPAEQ